MFFGHFAVAEYLLNQGADTTKKNNNGETPLDSLRVELSVVPVIAGFLLVEFELSDVKRGREQIENKLKESSLFSSDTPDSHDASSQEIAKPLAQQKNKDRSLSDQFESIVSWVANYPVFSYLWFLWFLWLYTLSLAILAWLANVIRSHWTNTHLSWASLRLQSPQALLFWIALTLIPVDQMESLGFLFGPDTSVGFIPSMHVFTYYAIFFAFGVCYYLGDESQGPLGQCWRWLLPLTLLVVFPIALEINLGLFGLRDQWISQAWIRPLSVFSQSLFAWWMSLACIGLFGNCMGQGSSWIRFLSDSSYWLYLAHLPLVIWIQSKIADRPWNGFLKLLLISSFCITVLLLSYELLVRHTWLGRFLNGKRSGASG